MITLATDSTGSIYLDDRGSLATLTGAEALAQTLGHMSQTRRGEMIFATNRGIPFWDTIFQTKDILMFEAAVRSEIMQHKDVTGIESFTVSIEGEELKYEALINSVYGKVRVHG